MGTHLLCLLPTQNKGKDGKGMEKKRTIKDGQIVVKNPLYQELPTHKLHSLPFFAAIDFNVTIIAHTVRSYVSHFNRMELLFSNERQF